MKAFHKNEFIDQERKLGDRRRLDTVVVSTINDADKRLGESFPKGSKAPPGTKGNWKCMGFGGSIVARQKLKGIDGRAPPGVEPAA